MPALARGRGLVLVLLAAVSLALSAIAADRPVTVFAAASLKNALDNTISRYEAASGRKVIASYAASSTLAKQIEEGAPADIFISADLDWMAYLAQRHLIKADTQRNFLGNSLVLIGPADATVSLTLAPGAPLLAALHSGRLAVADVAAVPAGKYAKAALQSLGLWDGIKDHIAQAENVRAALALVARREAPLGIVYATDASAEPAVKIIATFPPSSHPPIIYPLALLARSTNPDAPLFLDELRSPAAAALFKKEGFTVLP